jgi:transposase
MATKEELAIRADEAAKVFDAVVAGLRKWQANYQAGGPDFALVAQAYGGAAGHVAGWKADWLVVSQAKSP